MADAFKVLGAVDLAATTAEDIYDPGSNEATGIVVTICNRNTSTVKVRLGLSTVTDTLQDAGYILYDKEISANDTIQITGFSMDASYFLVGYSDTADVSMTATGVELS